MSNAPDSWTVPPRWSPNPATSPGWRIKHSWWLILPILGLGCLGGIGFLYIGFRAKRPSWWVPGIVYLLLGWGGFVGVGQSPKESSASDWAVGLWLAVWIAGIVHACLINSSWLQWRAHYIPWYAEPTAPPPTWQAAVGPPPMFPPTPSPLPPAMQPPPGAYYAPVPPPPPPPPVAMAVAVDVNTAAVEDFARLPGFDLDRAYRIVAERQNRSGFRSLDEFAFAAGLAPHQFAPLRARLTCGPPTQPPPGQHQQGRVLDV
ncbi:helix-hairpin-helix domain-containing protein [Dactylosporangium sp. NBC_01737]|uniref:ComEA family DNA-binding protein n=1 Tax=Dactylosporangium sp. NBC_01737 TaxID=2975959 RepID=UPI002E16004D|nr:helix-hairpin-helix domain-containing protein [Dactylosporangium sp. NBC_01737]